MPFAFCLAGMNAKGERRKDAKKRKMNFSFPSAFAPYALCVLSCRNERKGRKTQRRQGKEVLFATQLVWRHSQASSPISKPYEHYSFMKSSIPNDQSAIGNSPSRTRRHPPALAPSLILLLPLLLAVALPALADGLPEHSLKIVRPNDFVIVSRCPANTGDFGVPTSTSVLPGSQLRW